MFSLRDTRDDKVTFFERFCAKSFKNALSKAEQNPCTPAILQHCCKIMKVFEGSREIFFKKFPWNPLGVFKVELANALTKSLTFQI